MKITYSMRSSCGERPYNEDSLLMKRKGDEWLFLLADGLGGMGHGEQASGTAVQSAAARFAWDPDRDHILENCVVTAQQAVLQSQKQNPEFRKMATTFVGLRILGDVASWIHIGDSRLYFFRQGHLSFQTVDHSVPQMLVNMGEITPDQIRHHPDRNRLLKIIGIDWGETPGYTVGQPVLLQPGDSFLLCSDGLWEWVLENEMEKWLQQSDTCLQWQRRLEKAAEYRGKGHEMDNYSSLCVFVR